MCEEIIHGKSRIFLQTMILMSSRTRKKEPMASVNLQQNQSIDRQEQREREKEGKKSASKEQ